MPDVTIIEAPSTLGLGSDGVERLPRKLLDLRLAERIGARLRSAPPVPPKQPGPDAAIGILNDRAIADWSPRLADTVGAVLDEGSFPLVLGGDCTILLGPMLALRRRGRFGLLFIDGHADFFQPEAEPNGEGASMDLAWTTGHGPSIVGDLEGRAPLVRPEDVVAFGFRDHDDQADAGSQPLPELVTILDLPTIRARGIEDCACAAIARLTRPDLDGFFIHLDADVLNDDVMPAVDYRIPGGLAPSELAEVLRMAIGSGKAVGLEVTIYNPTRDPDGAAGRVQVDLLGDALAG